MELRSLECLGLCIENISSVLCTTILRALPQDILIEFNQLQNEKSYTNVNDLLNFLSLSLRSRERAALISCDSSSRRFTTSYPSNNSSFETQRDFEIHKSDKTKQFSACQLISTDIEKQNIKGSNCIFCDSSIHVSLDCDYAYNLSLDERKNILLKKGGCFKCLGAKKHISRFCKANITCCHCSGKHSPLMCFVKYKQKENDKNINPKADESRPSENTVLTNQSTFNEIYLQTLVVRISNKGLNHFVRVIIDSGSTKSYISKFVAEKMGLKSIGKERVTHGLFGGLEKTECHIRYNIQLNSLDTKNKIEIEVMDQKKICATVPKIKNAYCSKKLREKKIFLSDVSFKSEKCLYEESVNDIHLLLGADVAGKILTGKIEHLSCGLVAMQYILGWTVMGKVSNEINLDSSYLTLSLFVNEAKITDLWNLDSFGINDPCEKQSKEKVLTRFRMGKIGATADIRKTFLSISLDDHDRDYMRFIWLKDGDPEKEIRTLSDPERWGYVPDSLIPSDLPSRGCNVEALSISRWWEGPAYLQKPMNEWPKSEKLPNFEIINSERRKLLINVTNTDNKRIDWLLARVIQLFPSKDGDVRLTKVKMKNGEFLGPIKIGLYPWSCLLNWMPPRTYDPEMDYFGKNEFEFFELEKLKGGRMLYLETFSHPPVH
ncbi:integrase catalytic domain-containing protein [Trichonephila clavata]|uniref:Integrase catalytic domain-containing protein n=1 Tax=Trichonephila clavata TaxID=2740835 RepID=A0A8X6G7A3_TRICU|nr:integrase catalytic domain-containing protein [Trichonephila clavata]